MQHKKKTLYLFIIAQCSVMGFFLLILVLSLLRLNDVRKVLDDITSSSIPTLSQATEITREVQHLISLTARLTSSESQSSRRIVKTQLDETIERLDSSNLKLEQGDKYLATQLNVLTLEIEELNALVRQRIDVEKEVRVEREVLFTYLNNIFEDNKSQYVGIQSSQTLVPLILQIAQINQQLSFTVIKSPISGFVNDIHVEETSFVMPGNNIAEVIQMDRLKLIVNVSENDLSKIKEGQKVNIKTDVFPLDDYTGIVNSISYKADASKKFKVTIEVKNTDNLKLRSGMFAEVKFEDLKSQTQSALAIPREAIVGSIQNAAVYVVKDNKAILTEIQTGSAINKYIVVLAGLNEGDMVVTSGIINLKNNAEVKVIKS